MANSGFGAHRGNPCHGKKDGKFCSTNGQAIKKAADDHFNDKPLSERQAFVKKINNQLGGTPESFNQPVPLKKKKPMTASQYHAHQINRNNHYD